MTVQIEGGREVRRLVTLYNLDAILAVGYRVRSPRAVQFRKWATGIIESLTINGFAMDDERLKHDGSVLGKKYFEEQLQRIRGRGISLLSERIHSTPWTSSITWGWPKTSAGGSNIT